MSMKRTGGGVAVLFVVVALLLTMVALPGVAAQERSDQPPKMGTPVSNLTVVVFDTETTGLSAAKERIVEIGAIKIRNGVIIEERNWLINPDRPIPPRITKVHGITDEMVKGQPRFPVAYEEFLEFSEGAVLVAHNARFDVDMMRAEIGRAGLTPPANLVIDSLKLFRKWYPDAPNHKLGTLATHVGLQADGLHRGDADSRFTALVLIEGLQRNPECTTLRRLLAAAGGALVF